MYCSKIDFIENAAKLYGEDRRDSFTRKVNISGTTYNGTTILVRDLVTTNYLKKDNNTAPYIVDPRNKSKSLDSLRFAIYIKNNRIYVQFDTNVRETCEK